MRFLIRLGYYRQLLNTPLGIDFSRGSVFPCPGMWWPRGTGVIRIRVLVKLSLKTKRLVRPGQLENVIYLLKGAAVCLIAYRMIAQRSRDVNFLCHLVEPARLVATRKPNK